MNKQEDRLQILKMIENNQISSEEGLRLIEALGSEVEVAKPMVASSDSRILKVRVVEANDNVKVNVNIPLALIEVLADVGLKFLPDDKYPELKHINVRQIIDLIHTGINGKLVDVQAEDGTVVEVYVE